MDTYI